MSPAELTQGLAVAEAAFSLLSSNLSSFFPTHVLVLLFPVFTAFSAFPRHSRKRSSLMLELAPSIFQQAGSIGRVDFRVAIFKTLLVFQNFEPVATARFNATLQSLVLNHGPVFACNSVTKCRRRSASPPNVLLPLLFRNCDFIFRGIIMLGWSDVHLAPSWPRVGPIIASAWRIHDFIFVSDDSF